jgi:hypothetical protein
VRRIAFGGLMLIGMAVAVALVMWLAIFSVHENRASGAATATATARLAAAPLHAPSISVAPGTTCFVGGQECSETPCTEMIGSTMTLATVSQATAVAPSVSGPRLETPVSGCGTQRALPHPTAVRRGPRQVVPAPNPYTGILKSLGAQLSRRFP